MFTYVMDLVLVGMAVAMFFKGHYGATRQLALAPLAVAVLDAAFAPQLDMSLTPVLSAALFALQAVILAGSALVLYEDRAHARNKQMRRQRRRETARKRAALHPIDGKRRRVCA